MANNTNWLHISAMSGQSGQTVLTITADTNESSDYKTATIKVSNPNYYNVSASTSVLIENRGSQWVDLHYTADTSTVAPNGETRTITIDTTDLVISSLTITPTDISGITYSYSNGVITLHFPENLESSSRNATIGLMCDCVNGDVAIASVNYTQAAETRLIARYNVTSTTNPTQILVEYYDSRYSTITKAEYNGREIPLASAYTFSSTGIQTVYYTVTGTSLLPTEFAYLSTLKSVVIPDSITNIDYFTFTDNTNLSSVTFGSGLTSIGDSSFFNCRSLTSVTIPATVTSIGSDAFRGNYGYGSGGSIISDSAGPVTVRFEGLVPPSISDNPFNYNTAYTGWNLQQILIPCASYAAYVSALSVYEPIISCWDDTTLYFTTDTSNVAGTGETRTVTLLNGDLVLNSIGTNWQTGEYWVEDNVIYIRYSANPSSSSTRSWTINIYARTKDNKPLTGSFSITQNANVIVPIPYTADTSVVASSGETRTITIDTTDLVASSITVSVSGDSAVTYTYSNGVITVTFPENPTFDQGIDVIISSSTINGYLATTTISYVQEGEHIVPTGETRLVVIYNVTSTTQDTPILHHTGSTNSFSNAEINGTSAITMSSGHTFSRVGKWAIYYTLKDTVLGRGVPWDGDFENVDSIVSVVVPYGVTAIVEGCFSQCSSLTGITIPNSVTEIGYWVFAGSALKNCTLPSNLVTLGRSAFEGCAALTEIIIPDSVTSSLRSTFKNCTSLTSVTIGSGITDFGGCDYILPDRTGATATAGYAFCGCTSLPQIIIPNNVLNIANNSFLGCTSLTSVTIGSGVTMIGSNAFKNCSAIQSIIIPNTVQSLANDVFLNCTSLSSVTLSNNIYSVGGDRPYTGGTMPTGCFQNCTSLSSITIPQGVRLGDYCFQNCTSLSSITIESGSTLGFAVFAGCTGLLTASVDSNISDRCFLNNYSLSSITIGQNNVGINSEAFENCYSLLSVSIPKGTIGLPNGTGGTHWDVFENCRSLSSVTIGSGVTAISVVAFRGIKLNSQNFINNSSLDAEAAGYWGALLYDNIENGLLISGTTTVIGCVDGLQTVIIPNTITTLEASCFSRVTSITSATIPDSVTSAGSSCFYGCSNLQTVQIGNGLTSLPIGMFNRCSSLTSLTIPDSVQTIGTYVCSNCNSLSSITIGSGVTTFAYASFEDNSNLNTVRFTSLTAPTYRDYVFSGSSRTGTMYYPLNSTGYDNWVRYFTNMGWTVVQVL